MGQNYEINDCGEIINKPQKKTRRILLCCFLFICIVIAYPFIVVRIRYGGFTIDPIMGYIFGRIEVESNNERRGVIDRLGRVVVPFQFDGARVFSNNEISVSIRNKYGLINRQGDVIIPLVYEKEVLFHNASYTAVKKDGRWGVIDQHNNEIIPIIYENDENDARWLHIYNDDIFVCRFEGYWGAVNTQNKIVIPFIYQDFFWFKNGIAIVKKDNKYGIIDTKGKIVVSVEYEYLNDGDSGLIVAGDNGHYGCIDKYGDTVIPFIYEKAWSSYGGWISVKKDGKWGFINRKGDIIVDFIYDKIIGQGYKKATVVLGKKGGKKEMEIINPIFKRRILIIVFIVVMLILTSLFYYNKDGIFKFRKNLYVKITNIRNLLNIQSIKQLEIEHDGTIICDNYNEDNTDKNILLIPNIYNIIDIHISTRDKHRGQTVYTTFLDKHCQLLSNSQTDFMMDMLFETGNLKEQLELERFKESRYYSFFANDSNCSYTLVLNTDKKIIAQIIVDIMINVYSHPKGKFLDCSTEIL